MLYPKIGPFAMKLLQCCISKYIYLKINCYEIDQPDIYPIYFRIL